MNYNRWEGPKSQELCPYKKSKVHKKTHRKTIWRWRQRLQLCCFKIRNTWDHQNSERQDASLEPSVGAWNWGYLNIGHMRGNPKHPEFIYKKKLYLFSYVETFVTFKVLSIWCNTSIEIFFSHCSKQFWCLLVLLLFFVSPLLHGQNVSLWRHFSSKETNKNKFLKVRLSEKAGWSMWAMPFFVRNSWTLRMVCTGALVNHPLCNGQMCWAFQNISLKPNAASHNFTSWYIETDGFLEHSSGGGSL